MTKVSGAAGYQRLEKVGNYISDNLNKAADRSAANMRHQSTLNEQAKAREDKRLDEAYEGISVNTDALQTKATGFQSRDDVARDFAKAATERSMQYAEQARAAAQKGDWKTMNDLKGKIKRIEGDFKNSVNDEAILAEVFKGYQEKWQSGAIDDDDWLDFAEAMENFNYEITLDENDNKVIRAIELDDEGQPVLDEDGNPKVMEKKWADVVNQRDRPYEVVQLEDKQGKKGLIGDMLATMGKRKYDENTGQYIVTSQTWDEQAEKQLVAKTKALQANDRMMYSLLKQATGGKILEKKNSKLPEDEKQANNKIVEDFLRAQVKGGYDTEEKLAVRNMTVEERQADSAKNRAVTMRGQDLAQGRADVDNAIKLKQLALDEWKAKNPDASKAKTKDEKKIEENEALVVKFYDTAKKIGELGAGANDEQVQEVLDNSGLGFMLTTDWQFGFQDNEFDLSSVKDIKNKDLFKIVKGMAKQSGIDIKDTDLKEAIQSIQTKVDAGEVEVDTPSTMTDEEAAAQAQALIDKYSQQ